MKRFGAAGILLSAVLLGILWQTPAAAHDPRPVLIDIYQDDAHPGAVRLEWKIPGSLAPDRHPRIGLSRPCDEISGFPVRSAGNAYYAGADFLCSGGPPVLRIDYPAGNPSLSSFVRHHHGDGAVDMFLLKPSESQWAIPRDPAPSAPPSGAYLELGFQHILQGWDHLLFLVCLMALAVFPARILLAVTGFTIGHSLTLAGASLELLTLPVIYVEALIALSIVLVCVELLQPVRPSLARRHPVFVSLFFGLVHGLGFANELISIGFPETGLVAALLFFNLGVEAGQIAFALPFLIAVVLLQKTGLKDRVLSQTPARQAVFYASGFVACYWLVERSLQF